ncbi:MAG: hypothetical protein QXX95_05240 [Nitrososphaerales archaeon]
MFFCENCKSSISSPSKVWDIVEQEDKRGTLVEFRVALLECNRCGRKSLQNLGKTKLIVIRKERWDELNEEVKLLREKVKVLEEKLELSELTYKMEMLSLEVEDLKKGKRSLEREISNLLK